MAEALTPDRAIERLQSVLAPDGEDSHYLSAFVTPLGRHLAVERRLRTATVWLELAPPAIDGVAINHRYSAEDTRHSNLNSSRASRLAHGRPAVTVTVESEAALDALIGWYAGVGIDHESGAICLLGTVQDYDEGWFREVSDFIAAHGGWASWWSFRIKDQARPQLKTPFWLYMNQGGNSIVARARVEALATGDAPMQSPWQDLTEPQWHGKTDNGPGVTQAFRTWLKLVEIEKLPATLTLDDFEPVEGLSKRTSLLNQSTFGYARLKTRPPVNDLPRRPAMPHAAETSLNTILYGPPGTSKTFATIDRALRIVAPEFAAANAGDRKALKARFDALLAEGRIEFVTFHQSYSYEDFVQGIRASTENGAISYRVEDGVFKRMCLRAAASGGDDAFRRALGEFKQAIADEPAMLKTKTGKDFSLTWQNGRTLRLSPLAGKENADYPVSIENIERAYRGEDEKEMYNLSYVRAVMSHVKSRWNVPDYVAGRDKKPYVLIIDEINRGNIAAIFGELITLIEPSKRHGRSEALAATLPYAPENGAGFSVPDNLYIVGTMNTADRSLARLDTALRRRFDFVPMSPEPQKLQGIAIEGIELDKLLRRINERIELLYDRDHLIGHAYFMHMAEDPSQRTIGHLAAVFKNRILPLLEEYFFEDWRKIRLVLADNQKPSENAQFVVEEDVSTADTLFGDEPVGPQLLRYRRNDAALGNAESYRLIYAGQ